MPCCQLTTKPSLVDPGLRNFTSKNVFAVRLLPEKVAVKELPALTVLAEIVSPIALGGFADGVNMAATSAARKFGHGGGPGPKYVRQ